VIQARAARVAARPSLSGEGLKFGRAPRPVPGLGARVLMFDYMSKISGIYREYIR